MRLSDAATKNFSIEINSSSAKCIAACTWARSLEHFMRTCALCIRSECHFVFAWISLWISYSTVSNRRTWPTFSRWTVRSLECPLLKQWHKRWIDVARGTLGARNSRIAITLDVALFTTKCATHTHSDILWHFRVLLFPPFSRLVRLLCCVCHTQNAWVSDYIQFRNHSESHSRIQQSLYQNNHLKTSGERFNLVWNCYQFFCFDFVVNGGRNSKVEYTILVGGLSVLGKKAIWPIRNRNKIYSFRAFLWLEFHQMPVYYISLALCVCLCTRETSLFFGVVVKRLRN